MNCSLPIAILFFGFFFLFLLLTPVWWIGWLKSEETRYPGKLTPPDVTLSVQQSPKRSLHRPHTLTLTIPMPQVESGLSSSSCSGPGAHVADISTNGPYSRGQSWQATWQPCGTRDWLHAVCSQIAWAESHHAYRPVEDCLQVLTADISRKHSSWGAVFWGHPLRKLSPVWR